MNAAELRLGNWIARGGNGEHYRATDETISDLQYGHINPTPIPITEEVLMKCGAVRLLEKRFPSFNLVGMQINFINEKWIDYVTRIEITGLHHLQNIFFFTKNQELTYTP